ncbi:MAG: POTRA domain-containing protein [Polyangiaceae bacterium]
MILRRAVNLVGCACLFASAGCAAVPKGSAAIDRVRVDGNDVVSESDIEGKIATNASPKFLGLFRGVIYDYQLFDKGVLARDLERVERYYKARGFYEAKARAGRVVYTSDEHVEVTIEVEEGPRVSVKDARIEGADDLDEPTRAALEGARDGVVASGDPFEEQTLDDAAREMKRALTHRGHAWANVTPRADVDLATHRANIVFAVAAGPRAKIGKIRIQGLKEISDAVVRRALDLEEGEPYSTRKLDRARDAVVGLGAFGTVTVEPDLGRGPTADAVVDVVVTVEEQKLRAVVLGGGVELDSIRTEAHLHLGWEDKNFLGGARHFTVDGKPGGVLYPTRLPNFQAPTTFLPAERLQASLRQPGFIEPRMVGVLTQQLNTYPVLLSPEVDPAAPVLGYLEYKGSLGVERRFRRFFLSPSYSFQYNLPFAYQGALDPALQGLIVSFLDVRMHFDLRDDRIHPHAGIYLANDLQFAGIGGDALDLRVQPEVRGYIPLGEKVTIALRGSVGFLFPFDYGGAAAQAREFGQDIPDRVDLTRDIELIYLRGFFSGGPSSNRGYPLRGVGPHGSVPFLSPDLQASQLAQACNVGNSNYDPLRCGVPLGGLSLWESSVEVRFPIVDPLGATVFCDASDVAAQLLTLRFDYPHLSCGAGVRLDTPIGPVRADLGVRIPGAQYPASADPLVEGDPGTLLGAPLAIAVGVGEAF